MKPYTFICYSGKDKIFIENLSQALKSVGIWVDLWDLDLGEPLPLAIERGIEEASELILVLSRHSLESKWVKWESHMAVIRSIEDYNFRIIVVRIDNSEVPLRFKPYLYVDCAANPEDAVDRLREFLQIRRHPDKMLYRRHFVNRAGEIGSIESHVEDPDIFIICLMGLFGIGKTSLFKEAVLRLWKRPQITMFRLSQAHVGARLALELGSRAGADLPADRASSDELERTSFFAIEKLVGDQSVVAFNQFETLLDSEGVPHDDILNILYHASDISICSRIPIFILSTRYPKFPIGLKAKIGFVQVSSLKHEHLSTILETEINRVLGEEFSDRRALESVAHQLWGYPLGARLAAPMLVKYSPQYLLDNLYHIQKLGIEIAEAILANTVLGDIEVSMLEILSLFDSPLMVRNLVEITEQSSDNIGQAIDILVDHNFLDIEGAAIKLHPLLRDFYVKRVRRGPNFTELAVKLANFSKSQMEDSSPGTKEYVDRLIHTCRFLFLCGKIEEALNLRSDLMGELKVAAIQLYQRGDYDLSLRYCEEYLESIPNDFEVEYHRARCMSRIDRYDDSIVVLNELFNKVEDSDRKTARLHFALGRTFFERWHTANDKQYLASAKDSLLSAHKLYPEHIATLLTLGVILLRQGAIDDAEGFIKQALHISPLDPIGLSSYGDILWQKGEYNEAIKQVSLAVKAQPQNASFLFRLGRFCHQSGMPSEAYKYFQRAKASDDTFLDARLSLASAAIDIGKLEEAREEIEDLRARVTGVKKRILEGVEAEYELANGNIERARELCKRKLKVSRDVVTLGLMAKIEMKCHDQAIDEGKAVVAEAHKQRAVQLIDEGLALEPGNPRLLAQKQGLT